MAARRAPHQSPEQREIVERVMHEFKEGELESGSGRKVRSGKQAIAIALHEAGASNRTSPAANRRNLEQTRTREAGEGGSRAALLEEARRRGIRGRSKMRVAELREALARDKG